MAILTSLLGGAAIRILIGRGKEENQIPIDERTSENKTTEIARGLPIPTHSDQLHSKVKRLSGLWHSP